MKPARSYPSDRAAPETSGEVIVRVQLGAFRYPFSRDIFSEINDLVIDQRR